MNAFISHLLQMFDKLGERDRMAVLAALLAVAFGLDMLVIAPMAAQRQSMAAGMVTTAQGTQQAAADAEQQRQGQAADLIQRKARVDKDLAAFGLNNAMKDSLGFMLSRTLKNQAVTIQGLKALAVDQLTIEAPANPAAEVEAAAETASGPDTSHPPLYRHRYELTLQGDLKAIAPTLNTLEHDSHPLRVESVHMQAQPSGAIELTVRLVTIGLEKTWLAL